MTALCVGFAIDCDDTLLDTEKVWTVAERRTVERWGGRWSEALKATFVGQSVWETASRIAAHVGAPAAEVKSIHDGLVAAYAEALTAEAVQPLPGAANLLGTLAGRGIPVCVCSNSPAVQVEYGLRVTGLRDLVSAVQCPSEDVRPKPAPDLYSAACDRMGIVAACGVGIEDSQIGLDAARAAGLLTVGIAPREAALRADHRLPGLWAVDVDELLGLVRRRAL